MLPSSLFKTDQNRRPKLPWLNGFERCVWTTGFGALTTGYCSNAVTRITGTFSLHLESDIEVV